MAWDKDSLGRLIATVWVDLGVCVRRAVRVGNGIVQLLRRRLGRQSQDASSENQLRRRYALGSIDRATFERGLRHVRVGRRWLSRHVDPPAVRGESRLPTDLRLEDIPRNVMTVLRRRPRHGVLTVGLLAWVLWEQSGARPWEPRGSFEERSECVRALTKRVGLLEARSKRTTAPLVSEVHEVAASLGTLDDPRASVFLVCLPTGIDLRAQ
jgi:hypothetical protein